MIDWAIYARLYVRIHEISFRPMPATVAERDAIAPCAMQCTLIYFVGNKPFVIPPVRIKRYERIIWTEKGEIFFTEDAALDHFEWFHELPRKNYFGEDPNDPV